MTESRNRVAQASKARLSRVSGKFGFGLLLVLGCRSGGPHVSEASASEAPVTEAHTGTALVATDSAASAATAVSALAVPAPSSEVLSVVNTCAGEGVWIPGGDFWVGSSGVRGPEDEHPQFQAQVPGFCLGRTEVTVKQYQACVEAEVCVAVREPQITCNSGRKERDRYPMNCVKYQQAARYCEWQQGRLPSEVEWEYAARGGDSADRGLSEAQLDAAVCWKHARSCEVGTFPARSFGLLDMTGNVWEWTSTHYGPYPFGDETNPNRVYRGGSWSRRFEKWMSPTLRNRAAESHKGSHLGFRCVLPGAGETRAAEFHLRVESVHCSEGLSWNGSRCAPPGADVCRAGFHAVAERGCVLDVAPVASGPKAELHPEQVLFTRSPEFDSDCSLNQRPRPQSFRLTGSDHPSRNAAGQARGCKNRDVGVGWNSVCCPR